MYVHFISYVSNLRDIIYGCFLSLPMDCYGSEHCCRPENQCDVHEGDCNEDKDCQGMDLVHDKNSVVTCQNLNVF